MGSLTVRDTKFGKSRWVPLHPSTRRVLSDYARRRDGHLGAPRSPYFLVAERGGRLLPQYVYRVFWRLSREIELRGASAHEGPRLHDFRHRFAVTTLINWYRSGQSVDTQMPVLSTYLGHSCIRNVLVSVGLPRAHGARRAPTREALGGITMNTVPTLPALLERFFTDRLMRQRRVSPNTVASYRDTFRLLLAFAQKHLGKAPSSLDLEDIDATLVCAFLDDLETHRSTSIRTRNLRLTAIRSFFRFVSYEEPAHSAHIQCVLAVPSKRRDKRMVHFLVRPEIKALLAAPDRSTWLGRRDYILLLLVEAHHGHGSAASRC